MTASRYAQYIEEQRIVEREFFEVNTERIGGVSAVGAESMFFKMAFSMKIILNKCKLLLIP